MSQRNCVFFFFKAKNQRKEHLIFKPGPLANAGAALPGVGVSWSLCVSISPPQPLLDTWGWGCLWTAQGWPSTWANTAKVVSVVLGSTTLPFKSTLAPATLHAFLGLLAGNCIWIIGEHVTWLWHLRVKTYVQSCSLLLWSVIWFFLCSCPVYS